MPKNWSGTARSNALAGAADSSPTLAARMATRMRQRSMRSRPHPTHPHRRPARTLALAPANWTFVRRFIRADDRRARAACLPQDRAILVSPDRVTGGVTGSGLVREAARGHHRRVARLVLLHRPNSPRTIGIGVTEQVSTGDRVRVVLAEDHPIYRRGLLRALEAHEQLEVVGEARDGRQALALIRGKRPDVAVLDVRMPEIDGLGVLEILQSEEVATRVVLVSAFVDGAIVHQALVAGASGYVAKDADEETVCEAVIAASSGETAIS